MLSAWSNVAHNAPQAECARSEPCEAALSEWNNTDMFQDTTDFDVFFEFFFFFLPLHALLIFHWL